jgi:hypothetical protein
MLGRSLAYRIIDLDAWIASRVVYLAQPAQLPTKGTWFVRQPNSSEAPMSLAASAECNA